MKRTVLLEEGKRKYMMGISGRTVRFSRKKYISQLG